MGRFLCLIKIPVIILLAVYPPDILVPGAFHSIRGKAGCHGQDHGQRRYSRNQSLDWWQPSVSIQSLIPFPKIPSVDKGTEVTAKALRNTRRALVPLSKTVSRVMSWMVICLAQVSPPGSSDLPGGRRAALCLLFGLASDGVYMALSVTRQPVVSYTAFPPLPADAGGISLLHCPWSRLRQTLSGIPPCEARTFLPRRLSALRQRPSVLLKLHLF